jgi:ribosomal protein S18 acetylase RimI-like enzyme
MNVSLRRATQADAARIAAILLTSRAAFLPYAPMPHSDDAVLAWVEDVLLVSETVTLAVVEDAVAGVMATKRTCGISWITQLYLDPAHVGRGIGSRLLGLAFATLPRPIRLYTFQENVGARRFYERHDFAPVRFGDGTTNEERCPDVLYELSDTNRRTD